MAEREFFANNAVSTLDGAINSSVTSLDLTDASAFPAKQFRLIIDDEIMYCVSRSSNTLTVIRGYEGTTAASHSDLSDAAHIFTAGALEQVKLDIAAMMGFGRQPTTFNTCGDEFDDDNFSGWTVCTPTDLTNSIAEKDHMLSMMATKSSGADGIIACVLKDSGGTLSAGDYIETSLNSNYGVDAFPMFGLVASDTDTVSSGNQTTLLYDPREDQVVMITHANFAYTGKFDSRGHDPSLQGKYIHLRLYYRGSRKWDGFTSPDGLQWNKIFSNVNPGDVSSATDPRYVGLCLTPWSNGFFGNCTFNYFRTSF